MVAVRLLKPKVVLSQPSSEISDRNLAGKINFHLLKQMPSLRLNLEVDFRLYGRHIEK